MIKCEWCLAVFGFMLDAVRVHAMPPASEIDGSMTLPRSFQLQLK